MRVTIPDAFLETSVVSLRPVPALRPLAHFSAGTRLPRWRKHPGDRSGHALQIPHGDIQLRPRIRNQRRLPIRRRQMPAQSRERCQLSQNVRDRDNHPGFRNAEQIQRADHQPVAGRIILRRICLAL
jgi:hypothetical protein